MYQQKVQDINNIPLTKIIFSAEVAGLFAQVKCKQTFVNNCQKPIEAVYVFPMPEEASVVGCTMQIGDKQIKAELKKREQARKEYDEAVKDGHHASLLEQKRPNIFTMNVGGIEPDEQIDVEISYNQKVRWQQNGGRFNIPLVVAPRFIPGKPTGKSGGGWAEDTDKVPDASQITPIVKKEGVPYTASINVKLNPGFPCTIMSPSHDLLVEEKFLAKQDVEEIELDDLITDRDFVLCYRTDSENLETGVHIGTFKDKEFVIISIVPPAKAVPQPMDLIMCLDVSGSMRGPKIEGLKVVAEKVAKKLQKQNLDHRVGIVEFSTSRRELLPLTVITPKTFSATQGLQAEGGTRAGEALDYCFQQLNETERGRYILFVSDGQTQDRWSQVKEGVRVIAVGIDSATNMSYLSDIARTTGGKEIAIYPGEDYDAVANTITGLLSGPVLRDIQLKPKVGDIVGIRDVYEYMPAILMMKASKLPRTITVTGKTQDNGETALQIDLTKAKTVDFCHQLWAREKLRNNFIEEQIVISLKHGVLCSKTAFVAVHIKEVAGQEPERVEIPVALPDTWDYDAVFDRSQVSRVLRRSRPRAQRLSSPRASAPENESRMRLIMTTEPLDGRREMNSTRTHTFDSSFSKNLVEQLETLVEKYERNQSLRAEVELHWAKLQTEIIKEVDGWSETNKSKCFYLVLKLKKFGFKIEQELISKVSVEPSQSQAREWWLKALKLMGKKK